MGNSHGNYMARGTHLSKVFLLFLLQELRSHGTVQPRQSLADVWVLLLCCDLFNGLPLLAFEGGEPGIDKSPIREQSTGMYEP